MLVEQQLRDLRRALQRLAAAVMWRDGMPMPQVMNGILETMEGASQSAHRSSMRQCHRLWKSSRSASWSVCKNRPSINQETKHAEFPQICYIDKIVDTLVVMQQQVPRIRTVLKTMEVPINQVTMHAESPQIYYIDKAVDTLVVMQ